MSREILEAMHALAREKGIEPEKLMIALAGTPRGAERAAWGRANAMLDRQLSCRGAGSGSRTESGRPPALFA